MRVFWVQLALSSSKDGPSLVLQQHLSDTCISANDLSRSLSLPGSFSVDFLQLMTPFFFLSQMNAMLRAAATSETMKEGTMS